MFFAYLEELSDQRLTHRHWSLHILRQSHVSGSTACGKGRPCQDAKVFESGNNRHVALRWKVFQPAFQTRRIENFRIQGAAILDRSFHMRVIIRELGRGGHPSKALISKVPLHLRSLRQKSFQPSIPQILMDSVFVESWACSLPYSTDVTFGLFYAILNAELLHTEIVGHPHATTGPESGAADMVLLLDKDDSTPLILNGCRSGQTGSAGTYNEDVAFEN
jgi:hypothetical protein